MNHFFQHEKKAGVDRPRHGYCKSLVEFSRDSKMGDRPSGRMSDVTAEYNSATIHTYYVVSVWIGVKDRVKVMVNV